MVKLMALLAVAVVAGSAAAIKQDATESQGTKGKKFGLDKKGSLLLSKRVVYPRLVSTCRNTNPSDSTSIGDDNITSVDNAKVCGLAAPKLSDGVPIEMNEEAATEMPAEPVCGKDDNNATKIKKVKVLRAHRALRTVLVYCATDLREVCGFGPSDDRTCTEQVLNKCPNILTTTNGIPTLDPIELCRCEKNNIQDLKGCFKENQGLGNRRLLLKLAGGKKPDSDVGAKRGLGGAIRSIKQCFGNNTDVLSTQCTTAIKALSAVSAVEKGALDIISNANPGRRQLQFTSDDLKVLSDAADELDPPESPESPGLANGLGAPLALALAVLALNR